MPNCIYARSFKDLNIAINGIHNFIRINAIKGHSQYECNFPIWVLPHGLKKLTQSCLCESPFDLGSKLGFRLLKPKISSLSTCVILVVKEEFGAYFKITSTSCFKSLDWVTLWRRSSFLSSP
jgi:hypothetical protein